MALRNHAEMARSGSVSTAISPTDRLSLLPKELLDMIYSLVFKFDDGPSTIHIKPNVQPSKYAGYSRSDPDPMLSILALPRDRKYKALRRENPDEKWPANVEEDFFRGTSKPTHPLLPYPALTAHTQLWTGHTDTVRMGIGCRNTITKQYPR